MHNHRPSTSVVICAYTEDRFEQTLAAARSALGQEPPPAEVLVVVDHNPRLFGRLAAALPDARVMESTGPRGLSGGRNTGVATAVGDLIAFLDDDAVARPGWLAALEDAVADPAVMLVAGMAVPSWDARPPAWFPPEYLWVVGCSYEGQNIGPTMRNPIGCNMAIRRAAFEAAGDFHTAVGRVGSVPVGAEETELALRVLSALPGTRVAFARGAVVDHVVPAGRGTLAYFVRRCYHEGASKATMRALARRYLSATTPDALRAERSYVRRTLPRGMLRAVGRIRGPSDLAPAIGAASAIVVGVVAAGVGFIAATVRSVRASRGRAWGGRA